MTVTQPEKENEEEEKKEEEVLGAV